MDLAEINNKQMIKPLPFVAKKFSTMPPSEGYAYYTEIYRNGKKIGALHDSGDGGSAMARIYGDPEWDAMVKEWQEENKMFGEENLISEYFLIAELLKKYRRKLKDHLVVAERAPEFGDVTISRWKIDMIPWKKAVEVLKAKIPENSYVLNEFKEAGW